MKFIRNSGRRQYPVFKHNDSFKCSYIADLLSSHTESPWVFFNIDSFITCTLSLAGLHVVSCIPFFISAQLITQIVSLHQQFPDVLHSVIYPRDSFVLSVLPPHPFLPFASKAEFCYSLLIKKLTEAERHCKFI